MASGGRHSAGVINFEQLIALNDEMAALVRAGVPLEQGLAALGGDMPGRPGRMAERLAARMAAGESLSQILAAEDSEFPPVWRAVVEAGLRSGNLAAALESLSASARRVAELRRNVGAGLIYPLVVATLAYLLFIAIIAWLAPRILGAFTDQTGKSDPIISAVAWLGDTAGWWALPLPILAGAALAAWWWRSAGAMWRSQRRPRRRGWLRRGGIRQTLHDSRMATFAEVLALLLKEGIALPRSILLAAEASGDRALVSGARELAERLARGDLPQRSGELPRGIPPLFSWLLVTSTRQPDLSGALARSAVVYRERAAAAAAWTATYLPIAMTVLIGGTAVLLCGLAALGPMARLLYGLAGPPL